MIEPEHKILTVARQCELLNLPRSSYYYVSGKDDLYNRLLMNLIDEQYTKMPFCGCVQNDGLVAPSGAFRQSEESPAINAAHGTGRHLPETELKQGQSGAQEVSVFIEEHEH